MQPTPPSPPEHLSSPAKVTSQGAATVPPQLPSSPVATTGHFLALENCLLWKFHARGMKQHVVCGLRWQRLSWVTISGSVCCGVWEHGSSRLNRIPLQDGAPSCLSSRQPLALVLSPSAVVNAAGPPDATGDLLLGSWWWPTRLLILPVWPYIFPRRLKGHPLLGNASSLAGAGVLLQPGVSLNGSMLCKVSPRHFCFCPGLLFCPCLRDPRAYPRTRPPAPLPGPRDLLTALCGSAPVFVNPASLLSLDPQLPKPQGHTSRKKGTQELLKNSDQSLSGQSPEHSRACRCLTHSLSKQLMYMKMNGNFLLKNYFSAIEKSTSTTGHSFDGRHPFPTVRICSHCGGP